MLYVSMFLYIFYDLCVYWVPIYVKRTFQCHILIACIPLHLLQGYFSHFLSLGGVYQLEVESDSSFTLVSSVPWIRLSWVMTISRD